MREVKDYLLTKHSPETVKMYLRDIRRFLEFMGEQQALIANYQDIMGYVAHLRKHYSNAKTINRTLYGVKAWYFFLVENGQREDHPCRYLKLKDTCYIPKPLQDLFTKEELEVLMDRKERYEKLKIRNQLIISLLIYQGLRLKEITGLKTADADLEAGTIYIRETPKTVARTLKLKPSQVMLFYRYQNEIRPKLIKATTEQLLINLRGQKESGEGISYLIETFKPLYPERRLSVATIRQSVLANLLKQGKDLRVVQAFAGHKKASSTERYRQIGLEELKIAVLKHHPLG